MTTAISPPPARSRPAPSPATIRAPARAAIRIITIPSPPSATTGVSGSRRSSRPSRPSATAIMSATATAAATARGRTSRSCTPTRGMPGVVTQKPTAAEPGVRTYTCTVCGQTRTEAIPATGVPETCNGGRPAGLRPSAICPRRASGRTAGLDYCIDHGYIAGHVGNDRHAGRRMHARHDREHPLPRAGRAREGQRL